MTPMTGFVRGKFSIYNKAIALTAKDADRNSNFFTRHMFVDFVKCISLLQKHLMLTSQYV